MRRTSPTPDRRSDASPDSGPRPASHAVPGSASDPAGAWEVAGPASAPAIVLVHGSRLTRTSWRAVVRELAGDFRCLSVDLPGHGSQAAHPFTLDAACASVAAAIRAAGGPVILVGLSLGGYVAMATAARSPSDVRGLVITGATAEPEGPTAAALRLFAWVLGHAPQRSFDAASSWYFSRRYPPDIAGPIIESGYWSRGGAIAVRALPGERFRERLVAYGGPTLVINGALDLPFRLGERAFLRGLPNVRRVVLPRATHLAPLDRPVAFATAIRRFAASLPG